jgi:hypothetical protein
MKNPQKNFLQLALAVCSLFVAGSLKAQNNEADFSKFLLAQQQDASKLIEAYTTPAIKALSYGMTSGWYTTAKTHSKLGVDLSITMSAVFTPTSDDVFTPMNLGLQSTTLLTSALGTNAPTIFGPKAATTYQSSYTPAGASLPVTTTFNGPEGLDFRGSTGFSAVPVPMVQLGIGLLWNTDLKIRFIPEQTVGASKISMLGFGVMHDIKQHIPGIKMLPFDLSVLAAYNSVKGTTSLYNAPGSADGIPDSNDGKGSYTLNSWVVQGVISKKVAVMTFYGGFGYGNVASKVDITGTYAITPTAGAAFSLKDPAKISFDTGTTKLTAGIRFKFGPVYLSGDYTFQKYNALSLGFGLSIR